MDVDTNDLIDIGDLNEIDDISGYSVYLQSKGYSVYLIYWYKSTNSDAALLTQAKR